MRLIYVYLLVVYLECARVGCIDLSSSCNMARYLAVFGGGFVPTCRPDGSYEEIQCYDSSCWCVDVNGQERKNTRISSPSKPDCEYAAFAATEVDIIRVIAEEKGDEIELLADAFMSKPAYHFPPSTSVNTKLKKYFPPILWKDFSILVTVNPADITGGFIYAIMDSWESVVQFGVSLSQGENDYTQIIELWYTENMQMGSSKLTEFIIPAMVGRWSKFSISVSGDEIDLFMYCHNYTMTSVERMSERLKFADDSLLLVGHAGNVLQQQFKGDIQEILLTNNPDDAAMQCDESFQRERQESALVDEYNVQMGYSGDLDTEEEDVAFSGEMEGDEQPTVIPLEKGDNSHIMPSTVRPIPGDLGSPTLALLSDGNLDDSREQLPMEPVNVVPYAPAVTATKGEKGEMGEPGLPGTHGVNGIPGQMGEIGPQGPSGLKGDKGDMGVGTPGEKGAPGAEGRDGVKGQKGEAGISVVGPQGPPGASFFDQLGEMDSLVDNSVISSLKELKSFIGQKGEPGECKNISGRPGADGRDGLIGMPGFPGVRGRPGMQGERGYPGLPGLSGEPGLKGEPGDAGATGAKGEQGDTGPQGIQGAPGEPGKLITGNNEDVILLPGPKGKQGLDGKRGHKGDEGKRGERGVAGPPGPQGAMGVPGPQGLPGFEGLPGFDGLPGAPGKKGKPGNDGDKGEKGDPGVGLPGPPGPPGNSVGKPFFGAEWFDEDAGEQLSKIKGETGAKGDKGEAGTQGAVSYEELERLIPLFVTKGEKGESGNSGDDERCTSCKGMKGSQGDRGTPGKKGSRGTKGDIGMAGFPGVDGIPGKPGSPGSSIRGPKGEPGECLKHHCSGAGQKGKAGSDGYPGLPGLSGPKGAKGNEGEKGDKGSPGPPGVVTNAEQLKSIPGPPGPTGPPGLPGQTIVGLQGPPGPPGSPGLPGRDGASLGSEPVQSSYSHGVLLFTNQDDMSRASLAIPIGTLGYVSTQQKLYLRVPLGWQAVQMGYVVPLLESEMANIIPMWMDAPAPVEPPVQRFKDGSPALKLFALNEPMNGNLGGIAGADGHCYRHATKSGMSGEFRAILTSRLQDIETIVFSKYRDLPVINSKGEYLLNSWSSVSDGKSDFIKNAPIYTFDGTNINTDDRWRKKYLWHGAQRTGQVAVNEYCQAWTSDRARELGATSSFTQGQLLDQFSHTCDTPLAVLCIQIHI